jgi:trigger factor
VSAASVKHLDPTRVELEIPISPEEIEAARERAFRKLVKNAKIPGFRPGKAPRKIFEAQYGSGVITERAMEEVVPKVYERALEENDLDPLDQPQLELLPKDGEEGSLHLRATLLVRPRIELKEYKGIPLSISRRAATDDECERELEELRRRHMTLVPVDRPLEMGDVPILTYEGKLDGTPLEGWSISNEPVELVAHEFLPGFSEALVGAKAGETREIDVTFSEDFKGKDVAGKTPRFTVTVHENKVPELPALDEDFAKRFGAEMTLESLKAEVRSHLDGETLRAAREKMKEPLLQHLADVHDFPLPQSWLERETESILREERQQADGKRLEWEKYLEEIGKTEETIQEDALARANLRVKITLLVHAIAKAEKIEATQEDFMAELEGLARYFGQPLDVIIERLRPNLPALRENIIRSKTIDFLLDQAAITESPQEGT